MCTNAHRVVEVCNTCRRFFIPEQRVIELFRRLDQNGHFSIPGGELSISFVSEKKMRQLHAQFLNDASITDVITFPGDSKLNFAGEIIVCPKYAERQCSRYNNKFSRELTLYLVHGFLHLAGLRDKTLEKAEEMREAETYCFKFLSDFKLNAETIVNKK